MIDSEVEVKVSPPFDVLYSSEQMKGVNFIVCIGGRAGKKTYELSKWLAWSATIQRKRIVVLRDEKSIIKESILSEIWDRYETANVNGILDQCYQRNETELKERETNKVLIYTKGFRASSNQKRANLKGSSGIDIALIEEGEDVRDKDKFYTFIDSLRKSGCIVVFIMNTPDINHFILKQYFNLELVEDGYYKPTPKNIEGFIGIFTTYKDNPHLPQNIIDRYEAYGDKNSSMYDLHYFNTSIRGLASTGRKGQILTKVKPISLAEYMRLPFKEYYGQDFGTASPAALIGVKFDKNNCYFRQINYKPMSVLEIGKMYCDLRFTQADKIIVDYAEPEWKKLKTGWQGKELPLDVLQKYPGLMRGFYAVPCEKGLKKARISLMKSLNLFAVEESIDLWNEINHWCYFQDKNGNYTDEPIDDYDHLLDGLSYVVLDQRGKKEAFGI